MADIVDQFTVKFWNGSFYATVKFPDGTSQELKSAEDLTYGKWRGRGELELVVYDPCIYRHDETGQYG